VQILVTEELGCSLKVIESPSFEFIELEGETFFETDVSANFFAEGDESCTITGYRIDRIEVNEQIVDTYDGMVQVFPFGKLTVASQISTEPVEEASVFIRATNSFIGYESEAVNLIKFKVIELAVAPTLTLSQVLALHSM
jgi:hypothetical protein